MLIHRAYHAASGKYVYWRSKGKDLDGGDYKGDVPFEELEGATILNEPSGSGFEIPMGEIFLGTITTAHDHPKYSGHDLSPLEAYEPPVETSDIVPEEDVATQYSLNTGFINDVLANEPGTVLCLIADEGSSAGVVDLSDNIASSDWTSSGKVVRPYGGDDYFFGTWIGPSIAALQISGDLVVRIMVVTSEDAEGYTPVIKYGLASDRASSDIQADNCLYRLFQNLSNGTIYYSHEHGAGAHESVQFSGGPSRTHVVCTMSWYRQDNGDGTCTIWAYRNGERKSISSVSGGFTDNGDGTATGPAPDGGSNGLLTVGFEEDTTHSVQHLNGLIQVLDQLPSDPDAVEAEIADLMLNPTY